MKAIVKTMAIIFVAAIVFSCSDMIAELEKDTIPPPPAPSPPSEPPSPFSHEIIIHASDMTANDLFAQCVSLSGDYAIMGADGEDGGSGDPAASAGAAYIYERDSGGTWTQRAILHASDMQASDQFGYSVSVSGGYAIVGALSEDGGSGDPAASAGAAYIYERDAGGTWTQRAVLHASDMQEVDQFGYSVSISGGYAIVAALGEDGGSGDPTTGAGAAYIFERNAGGTWIQKVILHASDMQTYDQFGIAVSISGNYAIAGANYEDGGSGIGKAGAAYVFERDAGGTWTQKTILHASDMQANDGFGYSVSISGDFAIIGAGSEDGGSGDPVWNAGAAYIFERDASGNWAQKNILHASDMQNTDWFGWSVSISGDYAIVGADWEDGGSGDPATDAGASYIFERETGGNWEQLAILHASDLQTNDWFGHWVSISGSYAIVGALYEDGGNGGPASDSGAAYVYEN
jgi:hypothetical protein